MIYTVEIDYADGTIEFKEVKMGRVTTQSGEILQHDRIVTEVTRQLQREGRRYTSITVTKVSDDMCSAA